MQKKKKEINASKIYSPSGKFAERDKQDCQNNLETGRVATSGGKPTRYS